MKGADKILEVWGNCINTHDINRIIKLYDKDAMLWGTFSIILRDNHDLIKGYFEELFEKDNLAVSFKSSKNRVYANTFIFSGSYDLSYEDQGLKVLSAKRNVVLSKLANLSCLKKKPTSEGAFYTLLNIDTNQDDMQLAQILIEKHGVATIPGSAFGIESGCYLRLSYGALSDKVIDEGLERIINGLSF